MLFTKCEFFTKWFTRLKLGLPLDNIVFYGKWTNLVIGIGKK